VLGQPIVPITLVSANIGTNKTLPANGRIELGFDRLLQPASITRQTFVLENAGGNIAYTPTVAYDPVARIVTITPLTGDPSQALVSGQSYELVILAPQNGQDLNGLRAIDGATLPQSPRRIAFSVTDATPTPPATVQIDFCRDIFPITSAKCSLSICHGAGIMGNYPAAGLLLDPPSGIPATAVGRVSQGANTGPQAAATPPTLLFGEDMPIIAANGGVTGDPGDSWLMYKVLLAMPEPEAAPGALDASAAEGGGEDAGGAGPLDATLESADAGAADAGGTDSGAADSGATDAGASDAEAAAADSGAADSGAVDSGATATPTVVPPVDVSGVHGLTWQAISAVERATLSNYILGREMPFPPPSNVALNYSNDPLTLDEMERMSLWIAQGAPSPASCP